MINRIDTEVDYYTFIIKNNIQYAATLGAIAGMAGATQSDISLLGERFWLEGAHQDTVRALFHGYYYSNLAQGT